MKSIIAQNRKNNHPKFLYKNDITARFQNLGSPERQWNYKNPKEKNQQNNLYAKNELIADLIWKLNQ